MKKYFICILGLVIAPLGIPLRASSSDLNSLVKTTLENNFDIKIGHSQVEEKVAEILKAQGTYDINTTLNYTNSKTNTPVSSTLDGGGNASSIKTDTVTKSLTLNKKFSTGTTLNIPLSNTITDSSSTTRTIKETHETSVAAELTQPLLKGFTPSYVTKDLIEKEYDLQINTHKEREKIVTTILKMVELYYDTLFKYREVQIKKTALDSAKENQEFIEQKHKLGKSSTIEVLEAQSATGKNEEAWLTSLNDFENKKNELLTQIYADTEKQPIDFEQAEKSLSNLPQSNVPQESWEKGVHEKVTKRPEYTGQEATFSKAKFQSHNAARDRLPDFDLKGSVTMKGLAPTTSVSNDQAFNGRYTSWSSTATLKYPLFSYASRGSYAIKQLKEEQEQIKLNKTRNDLSIELLKEMRNVKSGPLQISAFISALEAEEQKYQAIKIKHSQGLISTYELNQGLVDLMNARLSLLKSKISYLKSYHRLRKSQGIFFENGTL
ncbi:MAG: TolC family protein [Bdellovibrio sp.]|nr:TolC family protein [Bdellovibrio sp.]